MFRKLRLLSILLFAGLYGGYAQAPVAIIAPPTPGSGCAPLAVSFNDVSTGNPTAWTWSFPGGSPSASNAPNVAVTYTTPGTYKAFLTTSNAFGTSNTAQATIQVNPVPFADFSLNKSSGCYPTTVAFTDKSTTIAGESISTYLWNFGDGSQSTLPNPSHKYTSGGNIQVTLYVTNNYGCTGNTQTKVVGNAITLTGGIFPNFFASLNSSCTLPVTASFTNTTVTTGGIAAPTWRWDFGDGTGFSNTTFSPQYTYPSAGNYNVRLEATSSSGCIDTFTINPPLNITPSGNLTTFSSPDTVCINSLVSFTNSSSPPPSGSVWDFGDGSPFGVLKNATHVYTTTGNYTVKLTNTYVGCTGSTTKTIHVVSPPVVGFTGTNLNGCKAPLTANFNNTSTGAYSWLWDFGDGNTSNAQNPSHTYNSIGSFNVTLTSYAAQGCAATLPVAAFVKVQSPTVTINNVPAYGCAPFVFASTATPVTVDGVAGYSWDLGNGVLSNAANPPAQSYGAGTYTVKLSITTTGGCAATAANGTIQVGSVKPTAAFSFIPPSACVGSPVSFTDASTGGANKWFWEYGDGSVDNTNTQTPTYSYTKPGTYSVRLTAYNNGCWDTLSKTIVVNAPLAYFKFATSACQNNNFLFTDSSTGPVTSWTWDFGDGSLTYSGQFPPVHLFPSGPPKTYTVSLTASNSVTGCTNKYSALVNSNQIPSVIAVKNPVCVNETVQFVKKPPGGNYTYAFEWGDGTPNFSAGISESAGHFYTSPGSYNVKVIETDKTTGCIDSSLAYSMVVNGPTANFAAPPALTCQALTFNFKDLSTASPGAPTITSWFWDFGDGVTSTKQDTVHTYAYAGNFTPSLVVTDNKGCVDTFAIATPITVSIPQASFSISEDSSCPNAPNPIRFINKSIGGFNPVYTWDFGDGSPLLVATSPFYTYTAVGNYPVTLSMKDMYGCISDTTLKPIVVGVPVASFTMSGNYSACPPFNDQFTFTGSFARTTVWDFTDGNGSKLLNPSNLFANPGDYDPNLVVTSPGGCQTAPVSQHVHIDGPVGAFTYSPILGCDSLTVNFQVTSTNVVSFEWNFADGSPLVTTTTPTISHKYIKPNQYYPIVNLLDGKGCKLPKIGTQAINVDQIIKTIFTADKTIICDTGTVHFNNTSDTAFGTHIINYSWDFGDGSPVLTGMNPAPSHKYTTTGVHNVTMTINTLGGCSGIFNMPVEVAASPNVSINGILNQCEPAPINFSGTEITTDPNGPLNWSWVFGNGQTGNVQNPGVINYPKAGEYVVYVRATNTKGCSMMTDTAGPATHLFIYPTPTVNTGPDVTICDTSSLQLNATGTATSYNWIIPAAGSLSCTACSNPVASSPSSTYFVVTGTTLFGCTAKDTINITVNTPVTVTATGTDSVCIGQSAPLNATGATLYTWTPSTGLNNPNIANPVATPDAAQIGAGSSTVITYSVTGTDNKKCYSDTKSIDITAFLSPVIGLAPNATINVGSSYQINATASTNITSLNWTPPNNLSCNNCLTPVASPTMTTKYNLTAINNGGCATTDSIRIQVICTGANFFVPNSFSPNGDGVNDNFIVNGVGLNVIPSITIYNRWGQIVFQKSNFAPNSASQAWDGTFNGKPAPADVYVYTIQILCENATLIPYHGNVTLIR